MHLCIHAFKLYDVLLQWADKEEVKKQRRISHSGPEVNSLVANSKTGTGQKIITFYFVPLSPQLNAVAL